MQEGLGEMEKSESLNRGKSITKRFGDSGETRRSKVRERNAAASPKFQWNTTAPADSRIAYRRNGYRKAEAEGLVIIGRAVGRKAERSKQE